MLSNASSQLGPGHQRLPAISSAADSDVHRSPQPAAVEPRSEGFVDPAEQIQLERVEPTDLLGAAGELSAHL